MKAIEVVGTIEENRRVRLDEPLPPGIAGRVRVIILVGEDEPSDQEWLHAATHSGAFDPTHVSSTPRAGSPHRWRTLDLQIPG